LRALPSGALGHRALPDSPTLSELFTHMHFVRLIFLSEDAPDLAMEAPQREWVKELEVDRLAEELGRSAAAVRNAVRTLIASGRQTNVHYDHPLLFLQHMIWHEGYHHGQIKLDIYTGPLIVGLEVQTCQFPVVPFCGMHNALADSSALARCC
jgi:uncharacterized damage-inducible protein DinB